MMEDIDETIVVPFHGAALEKHVNVTLINGNGFNLPNKSRVEVWKIKDMDGLCLRFFKTTKDGKISKLAFGVSGNAAIGLSMLLESAVKDL